MVRKVFQLVYKEVRGLHQAAYVLGLFTFGSQILALVRDRMLAHEFGAGMELDLYYAAFRIPDLMYVLFASTLSVYVLIPFVASRIKGTDSSEAQHMLSQIFSVFLISYTILAAVMWLFAPMVLPLMFPGMVENMDSLVSVMRILLLQPLLLGASSLFGVVTPLCSKSAYLQHWDHSRHSFSIPDHGTQWSGARGRTRSGWTHACTSAVG
jgi:putative peptidoglycan lipid II flippase